MYERLLGQALALMESSPEEAEALALRVIREGVSAEALEAVTEAWRILGFKRIAQADYEGALELFLEATEDLAARFGVDGKPASFLSGIGSAYHHLGFYATAESYLEEAKGKLDESSPYRVRASVHNNLGLVLYLSGDRERAERELRAALAACESSGDEACVVYVLTNLASVLNEDGKAEESERVFTQILERAEAAGAIGAVAGALEGLADCKAKAGRFDEALELNDRALTRLKALDHDRDLAHALSQRAKLLAEAGRSEEALELAEVVMASPAAKSAAMKAPLYRLKAEALEALGRWREACEAWRLFIAADPREALSKSHAELMDRSLDDQRAKAAKLEMQLRRRAEDLARAQETIIEVLAGAAEAKDDVTGAHVRRAARYVGVIAAALIDEGRPDIDRAKAELFAATAKLHDIGKIGVPDAILQKPGKLDEAEWAAVRKHPLIGERLIERAAWRDLSSEYAQAAMELVGAHHERWDGTGYPRGLKGEDIPLSGRIMAVADVYDAMRSARPYKPPLSHEETVQYILGCCGSQFDPAVCAAFERSAEEFDRIFSEG
jgi:HD-GYP domain-containing protein (c-di-GMP phosphodiesterase class II)